MVTIENFYVLAQDDLRTYFKNFILSIGFMHNKANRMTNKWWLAGVLCKSILELN